jgi:hypothetical protein
LCKHCCSSIVQLCKSKEEEKKKKRKEKELLSPDKFKKKGKKSALFLIVCLCISFERLPARLHINRK